MQAAELNQNYLTANGKDKARGKSLVQMRVVNRNTLNLALPSANLVGPGESTILVYEDHVDRVMASVEQNPEAIKLAEEQYELDMARHIIGKLESFSGTPDDMVKLIKSKANEDINAKYRKALKTEPLSVQGAFHRLKGRDMKPLVSAEVVENSARPEPQREAASTDQKMFAAAIVAAIRELNPQPAQASAQSNQGNQRR